jgi:hypothetical protein
MSLTRQIAPRARTGPGTNASGPDNAADDSGINNEVLPQRFSGPQIEATDQVADCGWGQQGLLGDQYQPLDWNAPQAPHGVP